MNAVQNTTFDFLTGKLRESFLTIPDKRTGKNISYTMADVASSAFSVFFTQEPSFLSYQRRMEEKYSLSNGKTIFGVKDIPSDTQIRRLLDEVSPESLDTVFWDCVDYLGQGGQMNNFRTNLGNNDLLVALDGTWYFESEDIHCSNCLRKKDTKTNKLLYYHSMINPCIAVSGRTQIIPLPAEFIKNSDGSTKQDCEQNAAKRWFKRFGSRLAGMGVTILGDDLYTHQPMMEMILNQGLNFILVCKEKSHKTVYEWIKGICEEVKVTKVTGVRKIKKETWEYKFCNGVEVRNQKDKGDKVLKVNFCEITIKNGDGSIKYKNAFVTNFEVTKENVAYITACGRGRWKIENENNNNLKTKGYHLEHNFGHGKKYLSQVLAMLNILAYGFHTIMEMMDELYKAVRAKVGRRDELFNGIRTLLTLMCFESFTSLMEFMLGLRKIKDIDHIQVPI